MQRYVSGDEDSARWANVALRPDDIVVSTRSKHGTTWVQAILLMLVHGPDLPAPLSQLSPWIDHLVEPIEQVAARVAAQAHRRVLKTHSPLDGLPDDPRLHRVVVARHPLDAAVSLFHQGRNIDRARLAELTGQPHDPTATDDPTATPDDGPELSQWMADWVHAERDPVRSLDSLQGVLWHLSDAWARRDSPAVTLVHYADLVEDLSGQVRRLADAVDLDLPADVEAVVNAAGFDAMRRRASTFVPDAAGVLRDRARFFRRGRSGAGAAALSDADLAHYRSRIADELDPDLVAWLHR